jgi:hypothetical protein
MRWRPKSAHLLFDNPVEKQFEAATRVVAEVRTPQRSRALNLSARQTRKRLLQVTLRLAPRK